MKTPDVMEWLDLELLQQGNWLQVLYKRPAGHLDWRLEKRDIVPRLGYVANKKSHPDGVASVLWDASHHLS
jgi:hypothetical protein